mmetsp:Transcript_89942/g.160057  ORF Transcript_89942/g.160057 Transcript_89942/m.160057 type:complete len:711 (-) Transcript_89942:53-2185(-)|eukprot:CAMPEP_0197631504 /NCGR_PEP_ID=MMETSP1338-20131121/8645_1 /TAXON_ID=43686 ORGANISM="Pelagodinium beii, Strain RCC1491" /NCGR_SAMPLE_ID=MMETSP1338 /ASSEMBLY_ACC=CAM_ASM_000754 /LENGTH=710 /DNA_ID=CAMNT_0043202973 /DNA_START=21 /DNA_END=2153 /DNA_ORIENTATION=-
MAKIDLARGVNKSQDSAQGRRKNAVNLAVQDGIGSPAALALPTTSPTHSSNSAITRAMYHYAKSHLRENGSEGEDGRSRWKKMCQAMSYAAKVVVQSDSVVKAWLEALAQDSESEGMDPNLLWQELVNYSGGTEDKKKPLLQRKKTESHISELLPAWDGVGDAVGFREHATSVVMELKEAEESMRNLHAFYAIQLHGLEEVSTHIDECCSNAMTRVAAFESAVTKTRACLKKARTALFDENSDQELNPESAKSTMLEKLDALEVNLCDTPTRLLHQVAQDVMSSHAAVNIDGLPSLSGLTEDTGPEAPTEPSPMRSATTHGLLHLRRLEEAASKNASGSDIVEGVGCPSSASPRSPKLQRISESFTEFLDSDSEATQEHFVDENAETLLRSRKGQNISQRLAIALGSRSSATEENSLDADAKTSLRSPKLQSMTRSFTKVVGSESESSQEHLLAKDKNAEVPLRAARRQSISQSLTKVLSAPSPATGEKLDTKALGYVETAVGQTKGQQSRHECRFGDYLRSSQVPSGRLQEDHHLPMMSGMTKLPAINESPEQHAEISPYPVHLMHAGDGGVAMGQLTRSASLSQVGLCTTVGLRKGEMQKTLSLPSLHNHRASTRAREMLLAERFSHQSQNGVWQCCKSDHHQRNLQALAELGKADSGQSEPQADRAEEKLPQLMGETRRLDLDMLPCVLLSERERRQFRGMKQGRMR